MSHTPGPWEATKQFGNQDLRANVATLGSYRIVCNAKHGTLKEDGDARLIAAAPELLVALKWMVDEFDHGHGLEPVKAARAAIAKAEGK